MVFQVHLILQGIGEKYRFSTYATSHNVLHYQNKSLYLVYLLQGNTLHLIP